MSELTELVIGIGILLVIIVATVLYDEGSRRPTVNDCNKTQLVAVDKSDRLLDVYECKDR